MPLGAIVSIAVPYFLFTIGNLELEDPYTKAVALYCLAAFLELFSELSSYELSGVHVFSSDS